MSTVANQPFESNDTLNKD